jgi:tRNA (guanosine-2'-O-)-methyltransferase
MKKKLCNNVLRLSTLKEWNKWDYQSPTISLNNTEITKIDQKWSMLSKEEVLTAISILKPFCSPGRLEKLNKVIELRTSNIRMVFENPANENNLWASLRTFDSFGIQFIDIILSDVFRSSKGTMRNALGSQKWMTINGHNDSIDCLKSLKKDGFKLYGSDVNDNSISIHDLDWKTGDKIAIVMGNEKTGISRQVREEVDQTFHIPMKGFAESFNVSAASAIVCSVLDSRKLLDTKLVCDIQKNQILLTWLCRSVESSLPLLRRNGLNVQGSNVYNSIANVTTKPGVSSKKKIEKIIEFN